MVARFDELVERCHPSKTAESAALLKQVRASARAENRAAAAQLAAVGELFSYRLSRCSETEEWAIDTMEAAAAEVAGVGDQSKPGGTELLVDPGLAGIRQTVSTTRPKLDLEAVSAVTVSTGPYVSTDPYWEVT